MKRILSNRILALILSISIVAGVFGNPGIAVLAADNEASVNGTEYLTLEEAISAADSGDVIELLRDVTVEDTITINKTVTLQAQGDSYSISRADSMTGSIFNVTDGLVIQGKGGTLTIDGEEVAADAPLITVSGGMLTQRSGGTVANGINMSGPCAGVEVLWGRYNFHGGAIRNLSSTGVGDAIYVHDGAELHMAGSANISGGLSVYLAPGNPITISSALSGSGNITVYTDGAGVDTCIAVLGDDVELSQNQTDRFRVIIDSTKHTLTRSGNMLVVAGVSAGANVAKIGDNYYLTLTEAFTDAASEGEAVIELLDDVILDRAINVKGNITLRSVGSNSISRDETLISRPLFDIASGSGLELEGSVTLNGNKVETNAPLVKVYGTFTVNDGVVLTGNINKNDTKLNQGTVFIDGGSFSMNGGVITGNSSVLGTVYQASGRTNINSGEIKGNSATKAGGVYITSGRFNMRGGAIFANSAYSLFSFVNINLSGDASVFSSATYKGAVALATGKKIKIAKDWQPTTPPGGYFDVISIAGSCVKQGAVLVEFEGTVRSELFKISDEITETFVLSVKGNTLAILGEEEAEKFSVYASDKPYLTLEDAMSDNAQSTSLTLRIVGDLLVSAPITVKEGVTLTVTTDINPLDKQAYTTRTLRRAPTFSDAIFNVEKGGTLIISAPAGKALVIDGEGRSTSRAAVVVRGSFTLGTGVTIAGHLNKSGERISSSPVYSSGGAVYVENKGTCNLNGGIIAGCYASRGGAVYVKDATLNISAAELSNNSALFGGAVYIETTGKTPLVDGEETKKDDDGKEIKPKMVVSTVNMSGGKLNANTAISNESIGASGSGGGVYVDNGSIFDMVGGVIDANVATHGSAICGGTAPKSKTQEIKPAVIELSAAAVITESNTIHLANINNAYISITSALTTQTEAITLSIPASLPQNMKLVEFKVSAEAKDNETAAAEAMEKKLFKLDETASEYYRLGHVGDKSVLVNTTAEETFTRYKVGKHYNGLDRYVGGDEEAERKKEEKKDDKKDDKKKGEEEIPEIKYLPIALKENSSFTSYHEMSYYPELYTELNACITAPFPVGTRIVMIDCSDEEDVGYYYYEVTGDETVIELPEAEEVEETEEDAEDKDKDNKKDQDKEETAFVETLSPDNLEIPLNQFILMGTEDVCYPEREKPDEDAEEKSEEEKKKEEEKAAKEKEEKAKKALEKKKKEIEEKKKKGEEVYEFEHLTTTEKLLFVVDFENIEYPEEEKDETTLRNPIVVDRTPKLSYEGSFVMKFSHYYPGNFEGERIDISANLKQVEYTVSNQSASIMALSAKDDGVLEISYSLTPDSESISNDSGVILLQMNHGRFPEGSVFVDPDGNSYAAVDKSSEIAIPLPRGENGEITPSGLLSLTYVNYYGTGLMNVSVRAVICKSEDGEHYTVGCAYDAESQGVKFSVSGGDDYSVLVTTPDGKEKPYYKNYEVLQKAETLDMLVSGLVNSTEVENFTLSLQKRKGDEYEVCSLSELFNVGDDYGEEVILSTGAVSLKLTHSLERLLGSEYKVVFKVGDAVEYIKVNVISKK